MEDYSNQYTSYSDYNASPDDEFYLAGHFGAIDYLVFIAMLAISSGIGVFYGCFGNKQRTTEEFLMGGRNMGLFPVSMSLLASFCSAIALLGVPAEIYSNGTLYWMLCPSYFAVMAAAAHLYLPVFYKLELTSVYEYLELRFSKPVRLLGSAIFTFQMILYMSVVVYAPALALSQVTGINLYGCVTSLFAIVIFYTALGGMHTVMWTDVVQLIVMFGAIIAVVAKGILDLGGFEHVWNTAWDGGRIELFNFDLDPRTRHTQWGLWIGGCFMWLAVYGVNQTQVQRYLTLPTLRQAQTAIWFNAFGLFGLLCLNTISGLVIYSKYSDCDPLASERIKNTDQLLPIFVMDTLGHIPGFPGIFVAGIFAGALSTVSSGLNSLAAITLEDYVKCVYPKISDETATKVSKISAVIYGLISFGLVFVAERLGGVFNASLTIFGLIGGPLLGVFSLGLFFPKSNSQGAFAGTLISMVFMLWIGIGANMAHIIREKLPLSVEGCLHGYFTIPPPFEEDGENNGIEMEFYKISYLWYSFMGSSIVIVVGLLVSFATGNQDPTTLNPELIRPLWTYEPKTRYAIGVIQNTDKRKQVKPC